MASKKMLQISGGIHKNKKIYCPPGEIRPAMAVMREVLFQVVSNVFAKQRGASNGVDAQSACLNLNVVDLFCGSGLMALECISRGATYAVAVESDVIKWKHILKNIQTIVGTENSLEKVFLYKDKAERFLMKNKKQFDFIYCDPPFAYKHKHDLLKKIVQSKAVHTKSVVAVHVPTQEKMQDNYVSTKVPNRSLCCIDRREVGSSSVYFYVTQIL